MLALVLAHRCLTPVLVPTGSMEPALEPGDRLVAARPLGGLQADDVHQGDVIVLTGSALADLRGDDLVKRVIGVAGDRVTCCGSDGRLLVNGQPLTEPYLFPGDAASEVDFDVEVPAGRLWVMGDHRSVSADSRAALGKPGGGMVRLSDVVGQVWVRYWPPGRAGSLG